MQVDSRKTTADEIVKVGDVNVVIKDVGKKPMVFGKSAQINSQKRVLAKDHEASSSGSANKYHQHRWCPLGLNHSQKRRLPSLRRQEQKEQEAEKLRDEYFNKYRPMIPQGRKWRAMPAVQSTGPVEPPQVTGLTGAEDRSDRQAQPVRPVEPVIEQVAEVNTSTSRDEVPAVPTALGDEELVDYEDFPERSNIEINVVRFSEEYYAVSEEEAAHLDFGPREAVFQKPKELDNHLKALYMRGHINGKTDFPYAC